MDIIRLKEANCKNCYRCLRSCRVKSIAFRTEQAEIIDKACVLCGQCLLECPQNAKYVNSDRAPVSACFRRGEKVYVSLAPSFTSAFPGVSLGQMSAALKQLGFFQVEETALGADRVTREYERLIFEQQMPNIIATACPSLVLLVEKHYPDLVPLLAPVVSPMVAHARMMREAYGPRIKVVFIGPCIAKKEEVIDPLNEQAVLAAMTFDEVAAWLADAGIEPAALAPDPAMRTPQNTMPRFYPVPGGIIRNLSPDARRIYTCLAIDGLDRCQEVLDSLRENTMGGLFLELNTCAGACLGGPALKGFHTGFLQARQRVASLLRQKPENGSPVTEGIRASLHRIYIDRSEDETMPDEAAIRQIMAETGKTSPDKELNCGSCGYPSCREKAIAVARGKASIHMCLPYFRERAESMSNLVIENTPNAIIILDEDFCIREFNPAASRMLRQDLSASIGLPVITVLPADDVTLFDPARQNAFHKVAYPSLDLVVEQNLFPVAENRSYVLLIKDITESEKAREKSNRVRSETVDIAQAVIMKQMRVAQEIASLLGETTAETKIALNQLKKSILSDMGEA